MEAKEPAPADKVEPSTSVPPAKANEPAPAKTIEPISSAAQAEPEAEPAAEKGTTEIMTDTAKVTETVKKVQRAEVPSLRSFHYGWFKMTFGMESC